LHELRLRAGFLPAGDESAWVDAVLVLGFVVVERERVKLTPKGEQRTREVGPVRARVRSRDRRRSRPTPTSSR